MKYHQKSLANLEYKMLTLILLKSDHSVSFTIRLLNTCKALKGNIGEYFAMLFSQLIDMEVQ